MTDLSDKLQGRYFLNYSSSHQSHQLGEKDESGLGGDWE